MSLEEKEPLEGPGKDGKNEDAIGVKPTPWSQEERVDILFYNVYCNEFLSNILIN